MSPKFLRRPLALVLAVAVVAQSASPAAGTLVRAGARTTGVKAPAAAGGGAGLRFGIGGRTGASLLPGAEPGLPTTLKPALRTSPAARGALLPAAAIALPLAAVGLAPEADAIRDGFRREAEDTAAVEGPAAVAAGPSRKQAAFSAIQKDWGKLREDAGAEPGSLSPQAAFGFGRSVDALLSGSAPFPAGAGANEPRPAERSSLSRGKLKPSRENLAARERQYAPPPPSETRPKPARPGPLKPLVDFWRMLTLKEAQRPALLPTALAAALLAAVPVVGLTAVHEFGHFLAARALGVPVTQIRFHIPGGAPLRGGTLWGYVSMEQIRSPLKSLVVTLMGPAFGLLYLGATSLAAFVLFSGLSLDPGLAWPAFAWTALLALAGKDGALAGNSGDKDDLARAWGELRGSRRRTVEMTPILQLLVGELQQRINYTPRELLPRALDLLRWAAAAEDAEGSVTLRAGERRVRFKLQGDAPTPPPDPAPESESPAPGDSAPESSPPVLWEKIQLELRDAQARDLNALMSRFGATWPELIFLGALRLYSMLLTLEEEHGPVHLEEKGKERRLFLK